jgi:predicted phosphodiesterase
MHRFTLLFIGLLLLTLLPGCQRLFEHSPYDGNLPAGYTGLTTAKNLQRLQETEAESNSFKVAFISDTHYNHSELADAIGRINADDSIAFVVFCGDYSDQGLINEYQIFYNELKALRKPFLTAIGNHEYLANAASIYAEMFGPVNYSFDYGKYHFVFFDDVFWEKGAKPDFDWIDKNLSGKGERQAVVVAHIPPNGDQYDAESRDRYIALMNKHRVQLSIHGHVHSYTIDTTADTRYITVPDVGKRQLCQSPSAISPLP